MRATRGSNWLLVLLLAATAACASKEVQVLDVTPPPHAGGPCRQLYTEHRCDAILAEMVDRLHVSVDDVTAIEIWPGSGPIQVRAMLADGTDRTITLLCPGIAAGIDPECMIPDPRVRARMPTGSAFGYADGVQGATPVPTVDTRAVVGARPLRVASIHHDGRPGHHEEILGSAVLPNGILTDAQFEMGVDWPDNVLFSRDGVRLVIRSVDLARPSFDNLYEHGWYEGVERVRAILVFDVLRAQPGATFEIRNLVVD